MMPECNNLFMRLALGMFGAGFAVVVISGLGLVWDGAYQLVYVLENSVVRVGYGRFTQGAIFAAVLALSRFTDNVNALTWAFGALHAALPLTALLGAWVILRDRAAWRFVWIALGIGLVTLPAQACLVCQSVAVVQINWILIAAILVGMPRTGVVFSLIAIPIMFFYHPVAIVCFAVDALLALWAGLRSPETRHRMFICCGCFALLTFAAVLRTQVFSNEYETEQLRLGVWVWTFLVGVGGAPPHAILLTWLAGALLVLERFAGRFSMALWSIALSVIAIAFILLGLWAHDTADWQYALEFRGWAIWLSLPVVILATIDSAPPSFTFRRWATLLIAFGFFFVLVTQALAWTNVGDRLRSELAHHSGCVEARHLEGIQSTALANWTVTAQSMLVQGKQTRAIAYYLESCGSPDRGFQSGYFLSNLGSWDFYRWDAGWFDKTELRDSLNPLSATTK